MNAVTASATNNNPTSVSMEKATQRAELGWEHQLAPIKKGGSPTPELWISLFCDENRIEIDKKNLKLRYFSNQKWKKR